MAVEASRGDQNSYAALQSPAMKEASNECLLEFYYHMFGEGKTSLCFKLLRVILKDVYCSSCNLIFVRHWGTKSVPPRRSKEDTLVVDVWWPWRWVASGRVECGSHPSGFHSPLWSYQNLQRARGHCYRRHYLFQLHSSRQVTNTSTYSYWWIHFKALRSL